MSSQNSSSEIEPHLKLLIDDNNKNAKKYRRYGFFCAVAICVIAVIIAALFKSCFVKDNDVLSLKIVYIAFAIVFIVLAIAAKTSISIANAYSLRCGQLEDINLIIKLSKESILSLDDSLKIMLSTRRDFIRDMVNSSVPDIIAILNRFFSNNRDESQNKSKDIINANNSSEK